MPMPAVKNCLRKVKTTRATEAGCSTFGFTYGASFEGQSRLLILTFSPK
jgi:hypothetical protein